MGTLPRRALVIGGLVLTFALGAVVLVREDGGAAPASAATVTSEKVLRDCKIHDAATLAALRQGTKRIAVVVKSFKPATPQSAALVVSLVSPDKATRREVAQFAVYPPRPFTASAMPQRFLLSLAEHAVLLEEGKPLCLEVGFATASGAAAGGAAEIEIEVVDLPGGSGK